MTDRIDFEVVKIETSQPDEELTFNLEVIVKDKPELQRTVFKFQNARLGDVAPDGQIGIHYDFEVVHGEGADLTEDQKISDDDLNKIGGDIILQFIQDIFANIEQQAQLMSLDASTINPLGDEKNVI